MNDTNITMVAFHGDNKPDPLKRFLFSLFTRLKGLLGTAYSEFFEPFDVYQIHATLIGMEVRLIDGDMYGHWFLENRGQKQRIDIKRLTRFLKLFMQNTCLFAIRFGGYGKAHCTCPETEFQQWECHSSNTEFHSCGRSTFEGSFYAYSPGPVVCTGWPVAAVERITGFPHSLYSFRKDCEKAGFLDKYHSNKHPWWMDDDCYIKTGHFKKKTDNLGRIIEEMRKSLSKQEPVIIEINIEDIAFIRYKDKTLHQDAILEKLPLRDAVYQPGALRGLFGRLREEPEREKHA